jgi:hypothetical protein
MIMFSQAIEYESGQVRPFAVRLQSSAAMWAVFRGELDEVMKELNEVLAA